MSEDLSHLRDEDYEAIEAIVDGSLRRRQGEEVLTALEAHGEARQEPDPLLVALNRAYEAKEKEERT
jgi:hypothetical protein